MLTALNGCANMHSPAGALAQTARQDRVRVAGIVLKWITADKERNYRRAEPLIREAAALGAELVITTECFLDGYAIRDKAIPIDTWRALGEEIPGGSYVRRLRALAAELRIHLVAGLLERSGEHTYNTAILIAPDGTITGVYRKHDLGHELVRNTPGTEYPVFETPFGRLAIVVCADRRNADLVRRLRANGAEFIVCPSGGMWGPKSNDFHLQNRSRENSVPIVFVHPIEFLVTGPHGSILARRFIGDKMAIETGQVGSADDLHEIALFDLEVPRFRHDD